MANAKEKLSRNMHHAEDKRAAHEQTIARLKMEYDQMAEERRQNDKAVQDVKQEADDIQAKVGCHAPQYLELTDFRRKTST